MTSATKTPKQELDEYYSCAWAPHDLIEIRALPTDRNGSLKPESFWIKALELPLHADRLTTMNQRGLNIFAGICPRESEGGRSDADSLPGRIVWADFDDISPQDALRRAEKTGMPRPTMAINSGHGCHLFWGLNDRPTLSELSTLVGDVAAFVASDPSVRNPSRVLRLPGFLNHKPPQAPCEIVFSHSHVRNDFSELRGLVPRRQVASHNFSRPSNGNHSSSTPERADVIERARRYVATVPGSSPGGRTNTAYRVAAVLKNDFGLSDDEALFILSGWDSAANTPPIASDEAYGPKELEKILQNAGKYCKKNPGSLVNSSSAITDHGPPTASLPPPSEHESTGLLAEFDAEARGERRTIALPWSRLSNSTQALRPGSLTILAGPAGHGKSLLVLQAAVHIHTQGESFSFLPLEDRKVDFERRLLAHLTSSWKMLETSQDTADERKNAFAQYRHEISLLSKHVWENPRQAVINTNGKPVVPALPYHRVIDWVAERIGSSRVVFIDPIAQIDFGEPHGWKGQGDFIRHMTGLAAFSGASIVLVAHTVKRPGKNNSVPLTGEDIQGAAEVKRLCHTVILLNAHDIRTSDVWRPEGCREAVRHDQTVTVDKARNGSGKGCRFAFDMEGPSFRELGAIAPKEARS